MCWPSVIGEGLAMLLLRLVVQRRRGAPQPRVPTLAARCRDRGRSRANLAAVRRRSWCRRPDRPTRSDSRCPSRAAASSSARRSSADQAHGRAAIGGRPFRAVRASRANSRPAPTGRAPSSADPTARTKPGNPSCRKGVAADRIISAPPELPMGAIAAAGRFRSRRRTATATTSCWAPADLCAAVPGRS